ncbi:MAG TPA: ferritin-like domain-containing protein [Polyangiaceae bacterium]|nr:ferritin-like domain-containing protein [Polyangiaceae bacterium]
MIAPLLSRLTGPWAFRTPARRAGKLYGFALAEQESMFELREAAALTADPAWRALYLRHALDEARHATMFWRRAAELRREGGGEAPPPLRPSSERLFERLGEERFLAFVHRGERRGRGQFEAWRDVLGRPGGDAKTAALFAAVVADERRHEAYTGELLAAVAGGPRGARRALRRAARYEAWRAWRRAGRALALAAYAASMLALYALVAPLALAVRARAAREPRGWRAPGGA